MNGKYLATNIEPLQSTADGKVLETINKLLAARNKHTEHKVELVAYSISGFERGIVTIDCLIERKGRKTLFFRRYDFYKETGTIDDDIKQTADYGIGFAQYDVNNFLELRDFYLQNK
jgi:hypothetical protein